MNEHSQVEINKVIRVLLGQKDKYTITVGLKSGRVLEVQCDGRPSFMIDEKTRSNILSGGYKHSIDIPMNEIEYVYSEENP